RHRAGGQGQDLPVADHRHRGRLRPDRDRRQVAHRSGARLVPWLRQQHELPGDDVPRDHRARAGLAGPAGQDPPAVLLAATAPLRLCADQARLADDRRHGAPRRPAAADLHRRRVLGRQGPALLRRPRAQPALARAHRLTAVRVCAVLARAPGCVADQPSRVRRGRRGGRLPDQHADRGHPLRDRRAGGQGPVLAGQPDDGDAASLAVDLRRRTQRRATDRQLRAGIRGCHPRPGRRLRHASARPVPEGGLMSEITLDHVTRWYGNVVAVNDVTMTLGPGVTGLLGPNGAGKTTLLHMMSGFLAPSRGTLTVDGAPSWRNPDVYRTLGLVSEREAVHGFLTGKEFVLASAKLFRLANPEEAARRALSMVEMEPAQDRRIDTYSKGMRQRIRVAGALVHDPSVLLLDEPFNGMDPRQRMHMMDLLHHMGDEGRVVLFSSHILEEVEQVSGTVQVMVAGRLAASGDFRSIRRLMTNRPHVYSIRSSDDRRLAVALMAQPSVSAVELDAAGLQVRAGDYGTFTRALPRVALREGVRVRQLLPADESLESVFSYLVGA